MSDHSNDINLDAYEAWRKMRKSHIEGYLEWRERLKHAECDSERAVARRFIDENRSSALFAGRVVRTGKAMQNV